MHFGRGVRHRDGLARLHARGARLAASRGSDNDAYPPMSDQLRAAGIDVQEWLTRARLSGGARPRGRDRQRVRAATIRRRAPRSTRGSPYVSFCDALEHFFLRGKHSVVITGTHGKTTTTSIVAWMLTHAGRDPSALIGGVLENFGGSFRLGEAPRRSWSRATSTTPRSSTRRPSSCTTTRARRSSRRSSSTTPTSTRRSSRSRTAFTEARRLDPRRRRRSSPRPTPDTVRAVLGGAHAPVETLRLPRRRAVARARRRVRPRRARSSRSGRATSARRACACRCSAGTTSRTCSARSRCARASASRADEAARAMAEFKGVKRRQELRGEAARRGGDRRLRAPPDGGARDGRPRSARATPSVGSVAISRAAQQHQPASRSSRATTPTRSPRADEAILAGVFMKADSLAESSSSAPRSSSSGSARRASRRLPRRRRRNHRAPGAREEAARTSFSSCRTAASGTSGSACSRACARAEPTARGPSRLHIDPYLFSPDADRSGDPRRQRAARELLAQAPPIHTPAAGGDPRRARGRGRERSARSCGCRTRETRAIRGPAGEIPLRVIRPKGEQCAACTSTSTAAATCSAREDMHGPGARSRSRTRAGAVVVSVGYRLAPEHPYPPAPTTARPRRCGSSRTRAREFGSERLAIGGESAGAHLSAVTMLRLRDRHGATPFLRRQPGLRHLRPDLHAERAQLGRADPGPVDADHRVVLESLHPRQGEARRPGCVAALRRSASPAARAVQRRHARPAARRQPVHGRALERAPATRAELAVYPGGVHGFNLFPMPLAESGEPPLSGTFVADLALGGLTCKRTKCAAA